MKNYIKQKLLEKLYYLKEYYDDCGNLETTIEFNEENEQLMLEFNQWLMTYKPNDTYCLMNQQGNLIFGTEIEMIEFLIYKMENNLQ